MRDDMKDRIGRVIAFGMGTDETPEEIAHKVLAAMREPTEAIVCAGDEQIIAALNDHTFALRDPTPAKAAWQAMIDAALQKDAADAR